MRMPKDMTGTEDAIFVSPGYTNMPSTIEALTNEAEIEIILFLIREVNDKFVLDLDKDVEMSDRENVEAGEVSNTAPKKFILVGCSHASRLSLGLEDLGVDAKLISTNGWSSDDDIIDNVSAICCKKRLLATLLTPASYT
jgi:hypothetical protein